MKVSKKTQAWIDSEDYKEFDRPHISFWRGSPYVWSVYRDANEGMLSSDTGKFCTKVDKMRASGTWFKGGE